MSAGETTASDLAGTVRSAAPRVLCIVLGISAALSGPAVRAGEAARDQLLDRIPSQERTGIVASPRSAIAPARSGSPVRTAPGSAGNRATFYRDHLLPGLSGQLEAMAPYQAIPEAGEELTEFTLIKDVTVAARHRAKRGASRAIREYVLDTTSLGSVVENLRLRGRGIGIGRTRAVGLGLGFSHGVPRLAVRRRLGSGTVRMGLELDGSLELEFRRAQLTRTRFSARYDAHDAQFDLGCRITF